MKKCPKKGDIIRIDGKKGEHLVTRVIVSRVIFDAVPTYCADKVTGTVDGKHVKTYSLQQGLDVRATEVTLEQLTYIMSVKFSVQTRVEYTIKGAKVKRKTNESTDTGTRTEATTANRA